MIAPPRRLRRRILWIAATLGLAAALGATLGPIRGPSTEARWRAIQDAITLRRWGEAERLLRRWVESRPGDGRAWLGLGSSLGFLGREDEAREAFRRVGEDDPSWARARLLLGEMALKHRECTEALGLFREAARSDLRSVSARQRLIYLLLVERRTEEARAVLQELYGLTREPRHLVTMTGLAMEDGPQQVRDLSGEADRLREELERFLARTPDDPWLKRARGLLRHAEGRPGEALADLESAADSMEGDPAGRLALAECRLSLGDLDGAEGALGPPPSRADLLGRWWFLRGRVGHERGRLEEAVDCWEKSTSADPRGVVTHYRLGQALARLGRIEEAGRHLKEAEAIRLRTDRMKLAIHDQLGGGGSLVGGAGACQDLGRLCLESGLPVEGRAWLEEAVRIDPTRVEAQAALERAGRIPPPAPSPPPVVRGVASRSATPAARAEPSTAGAGPRFEDEAARRGLAFAYDPGPPGDLFIGNTMGGGVGLLDFDDDGWLDVYFVNGCRLPVDRGRPPAPNRLFRNRGDGTFDDVTARAGVGGVGYGMGCAVGDFDNDGLDDLVVTGLGSLVLYRNRGDGTFDDVTARSGLASSRWCTAAGFGDLDGDGDPDLVVVTYVEADPGRSPECRDSSGRPIHCPPGKFPAQFDHLFRNNGDGTFTDVSREAGLEVPDGRGLGLAIADLDGDGRLDLFVANDAVPDFLFLNRGGLRFEEVGAASGVAYDGNGNATASMGVVADDLDGDGRIDLFHTNFRNEGNTLLRNLGPGLFADASARAGLDAPSRPVTGFGAAALDADNDGRLDLFVANGHVDDQPWIRVHMAQPPHWYSGRPGGRFEAAGPGAAGGYFARTVVGRGVAAGDLDNDGRVDLVVVHRDAPAALLRNASRGGHWLGLRLRGAASGRTPVGARVTCRAGGREVARWVTGGTGYLSAHDPRLWFGLGDATSIDELEVRWPSGTAQRFSGLGVDRILELREGGDPVPSSRPPPR